MNRVRNRCTKCKIPHQGLRKGSYAPKLKAVYARNETTAFIKIGVYCPNCLNFYPIKKK